MSEIQPYGGIDVVSCYDVLVSDITEASFEDVSNLLECPPRLSHIPYEFSFPNRGLFYGPYHRMFVPLVVRRKNISIQCIFLIDTGAPITFLRTDTMQELGFKEYIPRSCDVQIHGRQITVGLSTNHFKNVDLLGQDFFVKLEGKLIIDYNSRNVEISSF